MPIHSTSIALESHCHPDQYASIFDETETSIAVVEPKVNFQDIFRPSTKAQPSGVIPPTEINDITNSKSSWSTIFHFSKTIVFMNALVLSDRM